jgi:hypothetical protein
MEWSISGATGLSSWGGGDLERADRRFQGERVKAQSLHAKRIDRRTYDKILCGCKQGVKHNLGMVELTTLNQAFLGRQPMFSFEIFYFYLF